MIPIHVSADPGDGKINVLAYSAIINVSDSPCQTFRTMGFDIPSFWFPIQEMGYWGYGPFYGAAKVVEWVDLAGHLGQRPKPVLIHCHAGVNRSLCVALALLQAEGESRFINRNGRPESLGDPDGVNCALFHRNIQKGHIPKDIVEFLQARKQFPTYSIQGLLAEIHSDHQYVERKTLPLSETAEL